MVKTKVLPLLMYFSSYDHAETQLKAIIGLGKIYYSCHLYVYTFSFVGFLCIRYPELMMEDHIKKLYQSWLSSPVVPKKCQVCIFL